MEKSEKSWFKTRFILEIVGFPEEHINDTLKLISGKFGEGVKEIRVNKKTIRDAKKISIDSKKPIEESKFFAGFIEIEADVANLVTLTGIIFDWMPASIEIMSPDSVIEDKVHANELLNDLCGRLHQYDQITKMLKAQNAILSKELKLHKPSNDSGSPASLDKIAPDDKTGE